MTRRVKLDIVHYYKIEYYPPILNFIEVLRTQNQIDYQVYTSATSDGILLDESADNKLKRLINSNPGRFAPIRVLKQAYFNILTLLYLIWRSPDVILYYETISCAGPLFYKKFINKNVRILVHYHELTTRAQLRNETRAVKLLNPFERRMYPAFDWISHTNQDRINYFLRENRGLVKKKALHMMPNFPPRSWQHKSRRSRETSIELKSPVRTVLAGSVSAESMFLKEYCKWIIEQDGRFTFDIYSFNIDRPTRLYIEGLNSKHIILHSAIPYNKLPEVFSNFDIGVILYKAKEANMKYNVPNKLFEYHMCGLDVWFPIGQKTAFQYIKTESSPQIIAVDFENLNSLNIDVTVQKSGKQFSQNKFHCENEYSKLVQAIQNTTGTDTLLLGSN